MRRIALMLTTLAALALTACNNGASSGSTATQASVPHSVSGTVSLMTPRVLSPKASMTISLVDASAEQSQPLVSKTISPVQMPAKFTLDFDSAKINPADIYLVKVDLTDGQRTFSMPVQAPVITRSAPTTHVEIRLLANKTPSEMLEDQYTKLMKNLGAYKISNGRQLEKDKSRGWQTFQSNDNGQIVFVRENVDHAKKGFSSLEFAYRDGKPWFIVSRQMASQNARPNEEMRAGWDADGKLVVNEDTANGKTGPLSDAQLTHLKDQAAAMLKLAKSRAPRHHKH